MLHRPETILPFVGIRRWVCMTHLCGFLFVPASFLRPGGPSQNSPGCSERRSREAEPWVHPTWKNKPRKERHKDPPNDLATSNRSRRCPEGASQRSIRRFKIVHGADLIKC